MACLTIGTYHMGPAEALSEPQARRVAELLQQPAPAAPPGLGGRRALVRGELPGVGAVVVKAYWRGGWVRHFVARRYFGIGKSRAECEYEMLRLVRGAGVSAPEPVAFAWSGRFVVAAWLILREIPDAVTLSDLSRSGELRLRQVFPGLVAQITLMIRRGIYHVDLHPGNVLVEDDDRIRIVDFDKSRMFTGDRRRLRDRYLRRWNRAVRKHRLPSALSELLHAGLDRGHAPHPF
jgi:3-deoxy-D-manno-octulosonic acid kinase